MAPDPASPPSAPPSSPPQSPPTPPAPPSPAGLPTPVAGGGYDNPGEALKAVGGWFGSWSQRLADTSVQLGYALVGANWAVFGAVDKLLGNPAARLSLVFVLAFFAANLTLTRIVTELLRKRYSWAERHPTEWARDFERTRGIDDPWPSTATIDTLGWLLREIRTWLPLASGAAFLAALF
jgi:hypothetical protein